MRFVRLFCPLRQPPLHWQKVFANWTTLLQLMEFDHEDAQTKIAGSGRKIMICIGTLTPFLNSMARSLVLLVALFGSAAAFSTAPRSECGQ